MAILYSYLDGEYISLNNIDYRNNNIPDKIYVNITNQCPCACTFCVRTNNKIEGFNDLWLKEEPSIEDVINEFEKHDLSKYNEIIFCGYGEPLTRLDAVLGIADYIKKNHENIRIRINTNGLGDLINKKEIAPLLSKDIDSVSISLNASNPKSYLEITKSRFGIYSYSALLDFAKSCKKNNIDVKVTVVDIIGEQEIIKCRDVCDKNGLQLTVREFR